MPHNALPLTLDASATEAPYEQVRAQIAALARAGELATGHKLPTVRGLAEELGIAANTVAKAYRALESDGVIETRGRHGTFIAATGDATARELAEAALTFARRAHRLGVDRPTALTATTEALRATYPDRP